MRPYAKKNKNLFELETSSDGKGRVVRIDGKRVPQSNLSSSLKIIWFLPPMDRIWMESSKDRRKFLDRMVYSLDIKHAKRCAHGNPPSTWQHHDNVFSERLTAVNLWVQTLYRTEPSLKINRR